VVRLVNASQRLRLIGTTLATATYGVVCVLGLVAVLMGAYAVLGVYMFGGAKYGVDLDRHTNFNDLGKAMTALMRVVLGDWVQLRYDCEVSPPRCTAGQDCGSAWAPLYFYTFIVVARYMALNVVVAVVMESFTWLYSMERTAVTHGLHVSADDLRGFQVEWERLDPLARGSVPASDLSVLVHRLQPPLGMQYPDKAWLDGLLDELESLPGHVRGRVRFKELFVVLATEAMRRDEEDAAMEAEVVDAWQEYEVSAEEDMEQDAESRPVSRQDVVADVEGVGETSAEGRGNAFPVDGGIVTSGGAVACVDVVTSNEDTVVAEDTALAKGDTPPVLITHATDDAMGVGAVSPTAT